jgi:hypothetical protein
MTRSAAISIAVIDLVGFATLRHSRRRGENAR